MSAVADADDVDAAALISGKDSPEKKKNRKIVIDRGIVLCIKNLFLETM